MCVCVCVGVPMSLPCNYVCVCDRVCWGTKYACACVWCWAMPAMHRKILELWYSEIHFRQLYYKVHFLLLRNVYVQSKYPSLCLCDLLYCYPKWNIPTFSSINYFLYFSTDVVVLYVLFWIHVFQSKVTLERINTIVAFPCVNLIL